MPEEKVSTCPSCGYTKQDAQFHGDHRLCKNAGNAPWEKKTSHAPAADAGPRQPVQVERSLLEGILNFMNRRFDGDRLLKHQAHFIGELHRVLDAPVPQEAAPHSKKCAEQLYSSMDAKCICGSDTVQATAPDWAMRAAREYNESVLPLTFLGQGWDNKLAALIREAGSENDRELDHSHCRKLERLASATARLDQFFRMKDARPINPMYWDAHEERRLRDESAEASRLLGGESK